jgi:beta-galactosidase GanA
MSDLKIEVNEELTPDELADLQNKINEMFKSEPQQLQAEAKAQGEMIFFQEPILLEDEEVIEYMNNPKFKEGFEYGLRLTGIYTALISFGVEVGTANDIVLTEHTKFVNIETQKVVNDGYKIQALKLEQSQL